MRSKASEEDAKDLLDPLSMNFIVKILIESEHFKLEDNPKQTSGLYNLVLSFMILFSGDTQSGVPQKLLKTTGKFIKRLLDELDLLVNENEMLDEIVNNSLFKMICKGVDLNAERLGPR